MSDKVWVLSVDGGEVETFLGVYRSRAKMEEKIAEERDGGGFTEDAGFITSEPFIVGDGRECFYIHSDECEPFDYTLCFLIRKTEVIE